MFGKFREKLHQNNAVAASAEYFNAMEPIGSYAPKTKIPYKPTLVPSLEGEHKEILKLLDKVQRLADTNRFEQAHAQLLVFKGLLIGHHLKENTSIYIYLRQAEKSEKRRLKIQSVKSEMEKIGNEIMRLIDSSTGAFSLMSTDIPKNIYKIKRLLKHRILLEETKIFPYYNSLR